MTSLSNKTVLITGSTDGLGKDVAFEMAHNGATILLHGRNQKKGETVLQQIRQESGNERHTYYNGDFSSLRQVHHLANNILSNTQHLDILINNAGIGGGENDNKEFSEDGYELRFAVNYLASFMLTQCLLPLLEASTPSKIINVASGAQQAIDFDDIMMEKDYSGSRAYAQSKLALVMFTFDLADKLKDKGVSVNCLHPASMMDTKLVKESGGQPKTSVDEGTNTVIFVATSHETENVTGKYFDHHEQTSAGKQAYDKNARKELHALSVQMVELSQPRSHPLYQETMERL